MVIREAIGHEEGDVCNRQVIGGQCPGILEYDEVVNCSCHINPPCQACTSVHLGCLICGWEDL